MPNKFRNIFAVIVIDCIISFIVFFLLIIGFGTMPKISSYYENTDINSIKDEAQNYLLKTSKMFIVEILVGLAIILMLNYVILKNNFKNPFKHSVVIGVLYLIIFITLYFYLCQEFIQKNSI
jgi:hypothetical protein